MSRPFGVFAHLISLPLVLCGALAGVGCEADPAPAPAPAGTVYETDGDDHVLRLPPLASTKATLREEEPVPLPAGQEFFLEAELAPEYLAANRPPGLMKADVGLIPAPGKPMIEFPTRPGIYYTNATVPTDAPPGEPWTLRLKMRMPDEPGTYELRFSDFDARQKGFEGGRRLLVKRFTVE